MAHAPRITRPRLTAVSPAADHCLELRFLDGSSGMVNMKDSVFSLPGLAPLRDLAAFSGAVLGEYGWEVEWPQFDIQIGADTLTRSLPTCLSSIQNHRLICSRYGVSAMGCLLPPLVANLALRYELSALTARERAPYHGPFNLPVWDGKLSNKENEPDSSEPQAVFPTCITNDGGFQTRHR